MICSRWRMFVREGVGTSDWACIRRSFLSSALFPSFCLFVLSSFIPSPPPSLFGGLCCSSGSKYDQRRESYVIVYPSGASFRFHGCAHAPFVSTNVP